MSQKLRSVDKQEETAPANDAGRAELSNLSTLLSRKETEKVLDTILEKAVQNTAADGGSIYFVQHVPQDSFGGARAAYRKVLRFYRSINRHLEVLNFKDRVVELDSTSIAGHVAVSGDSVQIDDCYNLPKDSPFKFLGSFDKNSGYRTKSILAIPIKTKKNEVIGVVQLVNKLTKSERKSTKNLNLKDVISFTQDDFRVMDALASQASIALENARLTGNIERLFESFVRASVVAIEQRDPSTSGHSDRVAMMTLDMAKAVNRLSTGPFKEIQFSEQQFQEIRYASLLHDFGKIGVRENVLLKAKKLYPNEYEVIMLRLETMRAKNEAQQWRLVAELAADKPEQAEHFLAQGLWKIDQFNQKLEKIKLGALKANESQVMGTDLDIKALIEWLQKASANVGQLILTEDEIRRLSIPRGTLDEGERKEIESHVSHTFQFLSQIAWTEELASVPTIAHAHHEKLDGTGYPLGLGADQIPIQSRMMAISDIFDALTAMDRPYKKAVSAERAIDILYLEAKEGKLDKLIVDVFVEAQAYQGALNFSLNRRKVG